MDVFLNIIFSFPTIIFTAFLGFVCLYWMLSLIGLLDMDLFDIDLEMDGDVGDVQGFAGLMVTLGLTGVPFPLVLTFLGVYAWLPTYFITMFVLNPLLGGFVFYIAGAIVVAVAFAAAVMLTARTIRPLRGFFRKAYSTTDSKKVVIGKTGAVRSGSVSESFGEAEITVEGAHLLLKVRSDSKYSLKKGDRVVFIKYAGDQNAHWVMPEKEFLSE